MISVSSGKKYLEKNIIQIDCKSIGTLLKIFFGPRGETKKTIKKKKKCI